MRISLGSAHAVSTENLNLSKFFASSVLKALHSDQQLQRMDSAMSFLNKVASG